MKTKMTLTLLTAGILLAGTAAVTAKGFGYGPSGGGKGGCFGGPGFGGPAQTMFRKADANNDGVITREEAQAARDSLFANFDADKSGAVNVGEIDKGLTPKFEQMKIRARYRLLSRFDANGDGQISKEEFGQNALLRFNRADLNNDGKVTRDEIRNARMMKRRGMGKRRGGRMGYGRQGMGRQGRGPGFRGGPGMWRQGPGAGFPGGPQAGPGMMPPWGGMPPSSK